VASGNRAVVQLLLDAGADINALDTAGRCAIFHAFYDRDTPDAEMVKYLLTKGAKASPGERLIMQIFKPF
jgi:ankyrin repeat protein